MKLVKFTVVFIAGIIIGMSFLLFSNNRKSWKDIERGQSLAYLEMIELIANKDLFAGPLVMTEPNSVVRNCFFLTLKRTDDPEGALIVSDSAASGLIMNNQFSSHGFSVMKPGGSISLNNTWVSNFIADIRRQE